MEIKVGQLHCVRVLLRALLLILMPNKPRNAALLLASSDQSLAWAVLRPLLVFTMTFKFNAIVDMFGAAITGIVAEAL
jgi:hypothetical protein